MAPTQPNDAQRGEKESTYKSPASGSKICMAGVADQERFPLTHPSPKTVCAICFVTTDYHSASVVSRINHAIGIVVQLLYCVFRRSNLRTLQVVDENDIAVASAIPRLATIMYNKHKQRSSGPARRSSCSHPALDIRVSYSTLSLEVFLISVSTRGMTLPAYAPPATTAINVAMKMASAPLCRRPTGR